MNPERKPCSHRINVKPLSNDDELDINTQSSSHWDGLRHVGYREGRLFYNGATQEDISGPNANERCGVQSTYNRSPPPVLRSKELISNMDGRQISRESLLSAVVFC